MSTKAKPKIEIRGLRKSFGDKHVLNGVDVTLNTGESLVVIGGSGTGKSVTIKCITGLLRPDAGEIIIDGQDIVRASGRAARETRSHFGMLFQSGALFDGLSVWENVAFSLINAKRMAPKEAKEIAMEKLSRVGLGSDTAELFPGALSGGMQKRVGLARAIASDPDVIFFDEPTTGLDPITANVINKLIVDTVRDLGVSALSITHDMESVRQIADRVAMLHEGKIVWSGPRAAIDKSGNPYVAQFISGSAKGPIQTDMTRRQK